MTVAVTKNLFLFLFFLCNRIIESKETKAKEWDLLSKTKRKEWWSMKLEAYWFRNEHSFCLIETEAFPAVLVFQLLQ